MTRPRPTGNGEDQSSALRATADRILVRASVIAAPPAMDRALQLARIVLREAPGFGGREMRDEEIIAALKAEQIGPATFKKALSKARQELAKEPRGTSPRRSKRPVPVVAVPANMPSQGPGTSMAVNLDRTVL